MILAVSVDSAIRGALETFLANSLSFYWKLVSLVECQLSFKVSELLSNQVQFSSKTHRRKVREGRPAWDYKCFLAVFVLCGFVLCG